jgi:hypothetical protein
MQSSGIWPRATRQDNDVHHTMQAYIASGYLADRGFSTLVGFPAHPAGEVSIDIGAADGGTIDSGTDELPVDGGGTDAPPSAQDPLDIIASLDQAILDGGDVAAYTINGRTVQLRSLTELIEARKYFKAEQAKAKGLRRTRVRFTQ